MPRQLIARHGLAGALLYLCHSLNWRTSGRVKVIKYLIVDQPAPPPPRRAPAPSRLQVRQVEQDEYRTHWFPRPAHVIRTRFAQGSVCHVAFVDGQPVGCLWMVAGQYVEDEVYCVFEPRPADRVVWDYDVYVDEAHRLSRAFLRLWQAAGDWMRRNGYAGSLSRIDAFNEASIQAHVRAGARPVASMVFIAVGPIQLSLSSVPPRVALCVRERGMPRFALRTVNDTGA